MPGQGSWGDEGGVLFSCDELSIGQCRNRFSRPAYLDTLRRLGAPRAGEGELGRRRRALAENVLPSCMP